jgi:LDH2 family malate/lactate/ureidoglycolate dehydrogenase
MTIADHKGYGMAVAIEVLAGMLANAALAQDIPHLYKKLSAGASVNFGW